MSKNKDIFSFPLYYISFKPNQNVENHYKNHRFTNVNHFKAVDGRKLNPKKLKADNIISIRSYDDLLSGRTEHSGMPSGGAIGCTLSHYELWKKCIDNKWPYIIICEEDNRLKGHVNDKIISDVSSALDKHNGVFLSSHISNKDHRQHFFGTHFYIASLGACKMMTKKAFPIDVQTDWYIAHLGTTRDITLEGYPISSQRNDNSSIQNICFTCWLPKNKWYYISAIVILLLLLICMLLMKKRISECTSYESREE